MTKTKTKKKLAQSCQICRLFNGEGCLIFVLSTHFPFQRKLQFQREPRPPSLEKYVFYLSLESATVCFHSFEFHTLDKKSAPCFCLFSYFVFYQSCECSSVFILLTGLRSWCRGKFSRITSQYGILTCRQISQFRYGERRKQ